MIAIVEIGKIFKTGCIDNSQVCCIADALIEFGDEGFACRFVNKQLEELDIQNFVGFPTSFPSAKFVEVNQVWKRQSWPSKHKLAGGKVGSLMSRPQSAKIKSFERNGGSGVHASATDASDVNRIKKELFAKLDKANEELKAAIEAKAKMAAEISLLKNEKEKLTDDLDVAKKDAELKGRSFEMTQEKLLDAVHSLTVLKTEKEKNDAVISSFKAVFPEEVATLGARLAASLPNIIGARRVIYLYLAIITADPVEEAAFGNRFKLFDDELYQLFKDDPFELKEARDMFAVDINSRLTEQKITWDFLGEQFSDEKFSTSDSFGTEVIKVISALITKVNGSVVRRAKVKTE